LYVGKVIELVNCFKYLDITFQQKGASFAKHIQDRCTRDVAAIYTISKLNLLSEETACKLRDLKIAPIATYVSNICTFPNHWKQAIIPPLPKCKNPTLDDDLRPICILPVLSKVLEHVVSDQLRLYLKNNIIFTLQSGFRKFDSTTTALIKRYDSICLANYKHFITFMVLLDFSKAINSIDFDILASKLFRYFNFSKKSVLFLSNFLQDRS
jgi:hypothetical protein